MSIIRNEKPFEPKFDPVLNISQLHRVHATIPHQRRKVVSDEIGIFEKKCKI